MGNSGGPRGALQIPSLRFASVGMTILFLGVGVYRGEFGRAEGRNADPSTALRSGRDDNGGGVLPVGVGLWMK